MLPTKVSQIQSVRGGTHDQIYFFGTALDYTKQGIFGLISSLNPNLAHKINIAKNGTSAFYGDGVSSSVLISNTYRFWRKHYWSYGFNLINAGFLCKSKNF